MTGKNVNQKHCPLRVGLLLVQSEIDPQGGSGIFLGTVFCYIPRGRFTKLWGGRAGSPLLIVGSCEEASDKMPEFIIAQSEEDYREAAALLREYEAGLGIDLCFQGFPEELESLERMYGPPGGRFLIVRQGELTAGCVALRDLGGKICEMKRLYVRPDFRGRGLGRRCAEEIVRIAGEMGYTAMRLDTLPTMQEAIALLPLDRFHAETAPYAENPVQGALFMELGLEPK